MRGKRQGSDTNTAAGDSGVRKQTVILLVLLALGAGFLGGVALTIYRQEADRTASSPAEPGKVSRPFPVQQEPPPEKLADLEALQEAVERDPNDVRAWIELGNLQFDLERPHGAIEAYKKALALQPDNPDVLTDMGVMYRRIGRPEKAAELFREAHDADPNHFTSLYNLGVVLLHDFRDEKGAVEAWGKYLRLVPEGPQADRIRTIVEKIRKQQETS